MRIKPEIREFYRCECPESYDGPYCEQTAIGFSGNGYALYPGFGVCDEAHITVFVRTVVSDALIFYIGPEFADALPAAPQGSYLVAFQSRDTRCRLT